MKLRIKPTSALSSIGALALSAPTFAHPGHEPDNLLHALAHELASPRGILAIIILCIAAGLWLYARSQRK